nr:MAG TPA: hypothetical protein [Caudoviricetes sp.]
MRSLFFAIISLPHLFIFDKIANISNIAHITNIINKNLIICKPPYNYCINNNYYCKIQCLIFTHFSFLTF